MKKIIQFDEFTSQCPYFYDSGYSVNNGYNCAHPKCEESEKVDSTYIKNCEIGRCHTFTCPLVIEADEEDFEDKTKNSEEYEYEECGFVLVEIRDMDESKVE